MGQSFLVIVLAAFLASILTLFSGFGLGTLLLPVLAVFFPIETAIAFTAIVHLLNNLFKLVLLARYAEWPVVLKFGLPAMGAALLGAQVLAWLSDLQPLLRYHLLGREFQVMPVKLVVATLMMVFAVVELGPIPKRIALAPRYLPLGGLLSGFFGGLSGHQGALRSAFLVKSVSTKESFLGTGAVLACLVDLSRLFIYGTQFAATRAQEHLPLLVATTLAAFLGAWLGNLLVKRVAFRAIQMLVAAMLFLIALGLGAGLL